jgi:hypothetical protein
LGGYLVFATLVRPTHRDAVHGFLYPMPAHGPPVYLTGLDVAVIAGLLAVIVASVVGFNHLKTKAPT